MSRVVSWALSVLAVFLSAPVVLVRMLRASDFAEICYDEGAEQFMCRRGDLTAAYDLVLWGYPILVLAVWALVLVTVARANRRGTTAWHLPLIGLAVVLCLTALQIWAFELG